MTNGLCEDSSALADAQVPDGPPGGSAVCYGPAGAWRVCLDAIPMASVILPEKLDTDTSPLCLAEQPAGWTAAQSAACFLVGDSITSSSGATEVTGSRPLVLVARSTISIDTLLDVAGHRIANNDPTVRWPQGPCQPFASSPESELSGGGGAGGSFVTSAGNGGRGGDGATNGQAARADTELPTRLRGGCPGQVGGRRVGSDQGAGRGGGGVYVLSDHEIRIAGAINASGAGGSGGSERTGGSGGGSGGMIVLHAPTIALNGFLIANGGGGSGGGDLASRGADGGDPSFFQPSIPASGGGNGGSGFPASDNALDGSSGVETRDGGGGGGGAAGYIRANQSLGSAMVSPPVRVVAE